jgi:hypothetical protein
MSLVISYYAPPSHGGYADWSQKRLQPFNQKQSAIKNFAGMHKPYINVGIVVCHQVPSVLASKALLTVVSQLPCGLFGFVADHICVSS